MAIFYGISDSERQLLDKYSKFVKKIEDIPRMYKELEAKVEVKDVKGVWQFSTKWVNKRRFNRFRKIIKDRSMLTYHCKTLHCKHIF